jgi:hypothetical protein
MTSVALEMGLAKGVDDEAAVFLLCAVEVYIVLN